MGDHDSYSDTYTRRLPNVQGVRKLKPGPASLARLRERVRVRVVFNELNDLN